jgi:carboxylate-amine ligase
VQVLVEHLSRMLDAGEALPTMPPWFHRENKWRAARYGLDARVIVDADGTQRLVREHLAETVSALAPIAVDLGCESEFAGISTILDGGASYERQLAVADATDADLGAVVQHLIREFRSGPGAPVI